MVKSNNNRMYCLPESNKQTNNAQMKQQQNVLFTRIKQTNKQCSNKTIEYIVYLIQANKQTMLKQNNNRLYCLPY